MQAIFISMDESLLEKAIYHGSPEDGEYLGKTIKALRECLRIDGIGKLNIKKDLGVYCTRIRGEEGTRIIHLQPLEIDFEENRPYHLLWTATGREEKDSDWMNFKVKGPNNFLAEYYLYLNK